MGMSKFIGLFLLFVTCSSCGMSDQKQSAAESVGAADSSASPGHWRVTPLLAAVGRNDTSEVERLLDHGANPDDPAAVGAAARLGNIQILDVAIQWGIDKNYRANDGNTALHEAVWIQKYCSRWGIA
jgi:hypothetical protein